MTDPVRSSSCCQYTTQLGLNALNSFALVDWVDDAFADILGLQTYTHGTSPHSYSQILWQGANPTRGGDEARGEGGFYRLTGQTRSDNPHMDSRGKFYVVHDDCRPTRDCGECLEVPAGGVLKKVMPRMYATISTMGELYTPPAHEGEGAPPSDTCNRILAVVGGFFFSIFSPTLKFRFLPEEAEHTFLDDQSGLDHHVAAYTQQAISPDHIGLYGTVAHGFSGNLCERISNDPCRFVCGLIKLITAVALGALVYFAALVCPVVATIACVIGCYETAVCVGRFAVPLLLGGCYTPSLPEALPTQA